MVESLHNLGLLYARNAEYDKAIETLEKAAEIEQSQRISVSLAGVQYQAGRYDEARTTYESILAKQPQHREALQGISLALAAQGQIESAIEYTQKALLNLPTDAELIFNLGVLLERRGNLAQAEDAYRRAFAQESSPIAAGLRLAHVLIAGEEYAQAEKILEQVIEKDGSQPDALRALAFLHERRADLDKAEVFLRKLVRLNESDADDRLRLAAILLAQEQASLAQGILSELPADMRKTQRFLLLSAATLMALGEMEKAEAQLRTLLSINAEDRSAREMLSRLFDLTSRPSEAARERSRIESLSAPD
jgi:Flp pilus assembly protein TadD